MTLAEIERGLEIHDKQIQELRAIGERHERQMQELRDNQIVQGAMLAKASSLLLEVAGKIDDLTARQTVTQSGIESLVKFMDAFKNRLEGGNGHKPA